MTEKANMETQLQHFFQTTIGHHLYVMGESYYDEINDFPCSLYVYNTKEDTWETPSFEVIQDRKVEGGENEERRRGRGESEGEKRAIRREGERNRGRRIRRKGRRIRSEILIDFFSSPTQSSLPLL